MLVLTGKEGERFIGDHGSFQITIVSLGGGKVQIGFEGQRDDGTLIPFDRETVFEAKKKNPGGGDGNGNDSTVPPLKP